MLLTFLENYEGCGQIKVSCGPNARKDPSVQKYNLHWEAIVKMVDKSWEEPKEKAGIMKANKPAKEWMINTLI